MDPITATMLLVSLFISIVGMSKTNADQKDLMDYNANLNEEFYEEHQSPSALFKEWTGLGFNPNLVGASLLGAGAGQTATAVSQGQPANMSALNELQSMFGQMTGQSLERFINDDYITSMIDKNNADADYFRVLADMKPLEVNEMIRVNDQSIKESISRIGLNDENQKLIQQQNYWFGIHKSAEVSQIVSNVSKNCAETQLLIAKAKTEGTLQDLYKAQTGREWSQMRLNDQLTENAVTEGKILTSQALEEGDKQIIQAIYREQVQQFGSVLPEDIKERYCLLMASDNPEDRKQAAHLLEGLEVASFACENGKALASWNSRGNSGGYLGTLFHDTFHRLGNPDFGNSRGSWNSPFVGFYSNP